MGLSTSDDFTNWLSRQVERVESAIKQHLPSAETSPKQLHEAMQYAVLGPGKRVRAALVYAAAEAVAVANDGLSSPQEIALDHAATAVEFIHAYSLVHDDLPCMDDDDLRRGQPTVHIQFDESTALLAGDALQPLAFEILAKMPIAPALVVQAVRVLAHNAGSLGMAGGQAIDCASAGQTLDFEQLQTMHSKKTGALLQTSVQLGGIVTAARSSQRQSLLAYAQAIGLAFQVADDILDVVGDRQTLGKTPGKDAANNKPTYVSILGLEGAHKQLALLHQQAQEAIVSLGEPGRRLGEIADYIVGRNR